MNPDMDLVREYLTGRSEQSFERLVSRHIALVYSSALRQVRDPNLAEEITQAVFIILARKAASLSPKTILPGWLYRTTRFTAANALRTRATRQRYEQEAVMEFATALLLGRTRNPRKNEWHEVWKSCATSSKDAGSLSQRR